MWICPVDYLATFDLGEPLRQVGRKGDYVLWSTHNRVAKGRILGFVSDFPRGLNIHRKGRHTEGREQRAEKENQDIVGSPVATQVGNIIFHGGRINIQTEGMVSQAFNRMLQGQAPSVYMNGKELWTIDEASEEFTRNENEEGEPVLSNVRFIKNDKTFKLISMKLIPVLSFLARSITHLMQIVR